MKILDPASVVRETEFANAQNAAGVPDQIRNMYNRALRGERLGEAQRDDFVNSAKKLVVSQKAQLDNLMTLKPSDKKPKPSAREQLGIPQLPSGVIVRQR